MVHKGTYFLSKSQNTYAVHRDSGRKRAGRLNADWSRECDQSWHAL